jgi:flavin reductase
MIAAFSPHAKIGFLTPALPTVTPAQFGNAMARIAASVSVVACADGVERLGRTATSVFSLSATPPSLLVSIDAASELAKLITRTQRFSVMLLANSQSRIADAFAGRLDPAPRFDAGTWTDWPSGNPRLKQAATAIDCLLIGSVDIGSHMLFAGAIVDLDLQNPQDPLLWHNRRYNSPAPQDDDAPSIARASA